MKLKETETVFLELMDDGPTEDGRMTRDEKEKISPAIRNMRVSVLIDVPIKT